MKNKKIVVLLKYFKGELNPFDGSALECALETGAKEITVLSMAPMSALNAFQSLTRLGVKGVFISDTAYAGSDTQATSYILAQAIRRLQPDVIFCGRQSVDGDTAQVPPMLAQRLGFFVKAKAMSFDQGKITLRNGESFVLQDKTIVTFEKIRTLRFPSMFSKLGEVSVWDNQVLGLPVEKCGLKGSPTKVIRSYESVIGRRSCRFVDAKDLPTLIEEGWRKPRFENESKVMERLDEIYFIGKIKNVAERLAWKAIELTVENRTPEEIATELESKKVKILLWEDSEKLKLLASKVAVLTSAGICADCVAFRVEKGAFIMTRPALGGNVTADIVCTGAMAFATVRTVKPEGADVIFSVGKGAVEHIEEIKRLAQKYGAEVCCSRIVADSGKLPYEKQVGLTGKIVSPKVYVAFGISGAVQHTCAISGAETVIAVNNDKNARIFDYADYGIISDIKNLTIGE